jgi:hypothetical protein
MNKMGIPIHKKLLWVFLELNGFNAFISFGLAGHLAKRFGIDQILTRKLIRSIKIL